MESLGSRSVLPPDPPPPPPPPPLMGQTGVKIAVLEFLPDSSFIVAIIASECIKRYWETICGQSK